MSDITTHSNTPEEIEPKLGKTNYQKEERERRALNKRKKERAKGAKREGDKN